MKRISLCLMVCLCALNLRAQTPQAGIVRPDLPKVPAADVPTPPAQAAERENVRLDFPNAPVTDVLHFYASLLHKQVVCDNTVQGSVTLQTGGNVTSEQALRMIEEALFLNGFSLVDSEDGSLVRVIGLGKVPRAEGVPVFTSLDDLPKRERVVSYVVRLKQANPQQVSGSLSSYVPPNTINSFTPGPGGTLIITARTSMIRNLAKLADTFDVPTPEGTNPFPTRRPVVLPPSRQPGE